MSKPLSRIESEFNKGNFRAVEELFSKKGSEIPLVVGALAFLGEIERAETWAERITASALTEVSACRFFLGVAYARRSEYSKAKSLFARNAKIPEEKQTPRVRFFIHQGIAFYRFFCGRYRSARRHAQIAFDAALKSDFVFGEIFARDLLGHASIGVGDVRLGLKHLQSALKLAEQVGNGGVASALRTTIVRVRAQYGLEPLKALQELSDCLAEQRAEDTYSRAELYLELSRQLVLRGKLDEAKQTLHDSCDFIYRNQNRRQTATLNLRFSYIMHLEGHDHQALHLLRTAESALVPGIDRTHYAQLRGLRARIEKRLGRETEAQRLIAEAEMDEETHHNAVHSRIMSRDTGRVAFARVGEDPIGDLMDMVRAKDERAILRIVHTELFGLLPDYFGLQSSIKALVFDLVPGSVTVLSGGNVLFKSKGVNGLFRKIVAALSAQTCSKEDLIRKVWKYEYDPARHDTLAYSAITKLRKLLEPFGSWIEYGEDGYRLSSGVAVVFRGGEPSRETVTRVREEGLSPEQFPDLNDRQIQILERMLSERSVSVAECARTFATSKITASRDLSLLHQLGHCRRIGKGRATRYGWAKLEAQ